jgi:hypothetical protein
MGQFIDIKHTQTFRPRDYDALWHRFSWQWSMDIPQCELQEPVLTLAYREEK